MSVLLHIEVVYLLVVDGADVADVADVVDVGLEMLFVGCLVVVLHAV